jgi:hypothetical protein
MNILELMLKISYTVSKNLSSLNDELSQYKTSTKKIIFPKIKDNKRVSEQEARFLFTQELESSGIHYSIETPTTNKYKFSKDAKTKTSALIDLCTYKLNNNSFKRDLLIEFKAHTQDCSTDFEKLLNEPENGIFFHLLATVDNGTLTVEKNNTKGVLSHYIHDINSIIKTKELSKLNRNDWDITFIVASILPKFVIAKTMKKDDLLDYITLRNFFYLKYKIDPKFKTIDFIDINNWIVLK